MRFQGTEEFRHEEPARSGVLLVNLGTPDAPTADAVRRYLAEFLWDPRVVETPRWLWWLILHGVILRIRPRRVARAYQSVWTDAGSPLLAITRRQGEKLRGVLGQQHNAPVEVAIAMRYGKPSIASVLEELRKKQVRRLLVVPMYPQYSATTTASVYDAVFDVLKAWRWVPELRMVQHFHDHPDYLGALRASVEQHWQEQGRAERLLMSFHGIPKRYFMAGDPYHCECLKTGRLLAESLGLDESDYAVTFQSRFGREEWLKPYTDHTLKDWGRSGVKSVQVVCPGFSADCLETLEEIAQQNRDIFLKAGGKSFQYIPALNDSGVHIEALAAVVNEHIRGWPETQQGWNPRHAAEEAAASLERARAKGA